MTRQLVVVRHAKAEDPGLDGNDHGRVLTARGRRDASGVADHLVGRGVSPQRVLVSDAARTRQTWAEMGSRFPDAEVITTPRLYHAELSTFVDVLDAEPDEAETVMLVGHNPGLEDFVRFVTQEVVPISTATAVVLAPPEPLEWSKVVRRRDWQIVLVVRPTVA